MCTHAYATAKAYSANCSGPRTAQPDQAGAPCIFDVLSAVCHRCASRGGLSEGEPKLRRVMTDCGGTCRTSSRGHNYADHDVRALGYCVTGGVHSGPICPLPVMFEVDDHLTITGIMIIVAAHVGILTEKAN